MNKKVKTIILSLLVMALWGSLFPCIKIGYLAFGINTKSVADILMFAAMRFALCGALVCAFCFCKRKTMSVPSVKTALNIVWIGIFAIVLHYACTYIGLSMTDSSKTALLKQAGALLYICFSFLFFKDEKFSIFKIIGAIIGFCGIMAINLSSSKISFSFGDILILCASLCSVVSNIISRRSVHNSSPLWITGISQLFGGSILFIVSLLLGSTLPHFTVKGTLVFTYICAASIAAYTLWYYILKTNELSKLFIIKFAEPLFACIFGAILLGEDIFRLQYLAAFLLISLGILVGHYTDKKRSIE